MNFRLETLPAFTLKGVVCHTTNKKRDGVKKLPIFWMNFLQQEKQNEILPLLNQKPFGLIGMSVYNIDEKDSKKFDYYIGCSTTKETDVFDTYHVNAFTWAIFSCTKETMGKVQVQAIMKWLPKSDYKPLNSGYITGKMKSKAPDLEVYGKGNDVEIWIAVVKK